MSEAFILFQGPGDVLGLGIFFFLLMFFGIALLIVAWKMKPATRDSRICRQDSTHCLYRSRLNRSLFQWQIR